VSLLSRLRAVVSSEAGTTFLEYIIVAAVAVTIVLGAIQAFFGGVADVWNRVMSMLTGAA
jgi:Flp pilus assembly pilin Flp